MNIQDTTKQLLKHLYFFQANLEAIASVNIYNTITESFGRSYCNVIIEVNKKENLSSDLLEKYKKTLNEHFSNYLNEISFDYSYYFTNIDDDNQEERIHYEYINSLISNYLQRHNINVYIEDFKSLADVKLEKKEKSNNYEVKIGLLNKSLNDIKLVNGQYLATKNYHDADIRIRLIKEIVYGRENKIFSITTRDVLKNLSLSYTEKEQVHVNVNEFYSIFENIPNCKDKIELIDLITNNISFDGLVWRRPNDLW